MPSAGLPAGAVNPTGLDPRTPPRRRGPRQGRRGAEGNGAERRPQGSALTGWRRAVGWSRCLVGDRTPREDAPSSDAEGGITRSLCVLGRHLTRAYDGRCCGARGPRRLLTSRRRPPMRKSVTPITVQGQSAGVINGVVVKPAMIAGTPSAKNTRGQSQGMTRRARGESPSGSGEGSLSRSTSTVAAIAKRKKQQPSAVSRRPDTMWLSCRNQACMLVR